MDSPDTATAAADDQDFYRYKREAVQFVQLDIKEAIDAFLQTMSRHVAALNAANDGLHSAANHLGGAAKRLGALPDTAPHAYHQVIQAYRAIANADPARNGGLTPLGPTS